MFQTWIWLKFLCCNDLETKKVTVEENINKYIIITPPPFLLCSIQIRSQFSLLPFIFPFFINCLLYRLVLCLTEKADQLNRYYQTPFIAERVKIQKAGSAHWLNRCSIGYWKENNSPYGYILLYIWEQICHRARGHSLVGFHCFSQGDCWKTDAWRHRLSCFQKLQRCIKLS